MTRRSTARRTWFAAGCIALFVGACGSDDQSANDASAGLDEPDITDEQFSVQTTISLPDAEAGQASSDSENALPTSGSSLRPLWLVEDPDRISSESLGTIGSNVVVRTSNTVSALEPGTGAISWSYSWEDDLRWIAYADDGLLLHFLDQLVRLNPSDGTQVYAIDIGSARVLAVDNAGQIVTTDSVRDIGTGLQVGPPPRDYGFERVFSAGDDQRYWNMRGFDQDTILSSVFEPVDTTLEGSVGPGFGSGIFEDGSLLVEKSATPDDFPSPVIITPDDRVIGPGDAVGYRYFKGTDCPTTNLMVDCLSSELDYRTLLATWPPDLAAMVESCQPAGPSSFSMLPRVAEGLVLCATEEDELFVVDIGAGEVVGQAPTDIDVGDGFWDAEVIDGTLVVMNSDGQAEGFALGG